MVIQEARELKRGDILMFRGTGPVFAILSFALGLFDKKWRGLTWRPWHVAFVADEVANCYTIGESVAKGVTEAWLNEKSDFKVYRWLDKEPPRYKVQKFLLDRAYCRYDASVYLWTGIQYITLRIIEWFQKKFIPWHKFTISLPRVLNQRYTCWEFLYLFCREMNKPIQESLGLPATRYPMITDLLKAIVDTQIT